jgi:hypothetical protein
MAKKSKKAEKAKKKPAVKASKPAAKKAPKVAKKLVAKVVKKAAPKKAAPVKALKKPEKSVGKKLTAKLQAKPIPPKPAKKEKLTGKPGKVEAEPTVEVEASAEGEEVEAGEEVVLTDAEGRRYCRVKDCDQLASVDGYCRYHYLLYWKKIQIRKKILTEGKLERYIEELTARYPDKFLDMLKKDLRSEKEFLAAIQELEIDESANESEFEDETQTYIDEVRGMGEPAARDEEDF